MLVGLKHEGNVGAIARVMKNFGFHELRLVNCALGEEARKRAMHANDILASATQFRSFEAAIEGLDIVAGTSGVVSEKERHYLRHSLTPEGFLRKYRKFEGKIGLVFGREDFGLLNEELAKCDILLHIPTAGEYPVMNVSHAAAVILYLLREKGRRRQFSRPEKLEIKELHLAFSELLDAVNYPGHRKRNAQIMFRRLIGRAGITKLETSMLIGVFRRAAKLGGEKDED
ncbi:MAG: RNA methyltransferase [Thermoplasmata archaeon]